MRMITNKLSQKTFRNILFLGVIIFIVVPLHSQIVSISGKAAGVDNELVRVITYDDQFSRLEKTIASTFTDQAGNFDFEVELSQTNFAYLAVGIKRGEFYISPNSTYQFDILPDTNSQPGSIFDELPLQFTCVYDDEGLSDAIGTFNVQYNTFLYQNANKIYYGRNKAFIMGFEDKINEQFNSVHNNYLKNYIRYSFASLEWTSKTKKNDSIIKEYFVGNEILYNNIQFTEFFTDFFKTYFISDKVYSYHELIEAINQGSGIQDVKSLILRKNLFVDDPKLTELIATMLVAKKYYNPDVRRDQVLKLLNELAQESIYPDNARVAGNFAKKLKILESGTEAPGFNLAGIDDIEHNLNDYQGKFVLLSFMKTTCKICLEHLHFLDEIAEQFNGKVQNITVVYGDDFQGVVQFANDRDFDWPFLNLDNNILLLEAYNIRAYPSYVIINPDGTLSMAIAPMPDENLDLFLNRQIKRFNSKQSND